MHCSHLQYLLLTHPALLESEMHCSHLQYSPTIFATNPSRSLRERDAPTMFAAHPTLLAVATYNLPLIPVSQLQPQPSIYHSSIPPLTERDAATYVAAHPIAAAAATCNICRSSHCP